MLILFPVGMILIIDEKKSVLLAEITMVYDQLICKVVSELYGKKDNVCIQLILNLFI